VQFGLRLRSLLAAVAISAGLLFLHTRVFATQWERTWWDVKPFLNLIFVPFAVTVLIQSKPSSPLVFGTVALTSALLVLWLELPRPLPPILFGAWTDRPVDVVTAWCCSDRFDATDHLVYWFSTYGALLDLFSMVLLVSLLASLGNRSLAVRLRVVGAIFLCLVRLFDWAISPRLRGGGTPFPWIAADYAPSRGVQAWVWGELSLSGVVSRVTVVGVAELVALVGILGFLAVVLVRVGAAQRGDIAGPERAGPALGADMSSAARDRARS
jgi:hypothetical protein